MQNVQFVPKLCRALFEIQFDVNTTTLRVKIIVLSIKAPAFCSCHERNEDGNCYYERWMKNHQRFNRVPFPIQVEILLLLKNA